METLQKESYTNYNCDKKDLERINKRNRGIIRNLRRVGILSSLLILSASIMNIILINIQGDMNRPYMNILLLSGMILMLFTQLHFTFLSTEYRTKEDESKSIKGSFVIMIILIGTMFLNLSIPSSGLLAGLGIFVFIFLYFFGQHNNAYGFLTLHVVTTFVLIALVTSMNRDGFADYDVLEIAIKWSMFTPGIVFGVGLFFENIKHKRVNVIAGIVGALCVLLSGYVFEPYNSDLFFVYSTSIIGHIALLVHYWFLEYDDEKRYVVGKLHK